MRYYEFVIGGLEEAVMDLIDDQDCLGRRYSYSSPICTINQYMYEHLKKNTGFFCYTEEFDEKTLAALCFDERKDLIENVYNYIFRELESKFIIRKTQAVPVEITMYDFFDHYKEANRRELVFFGHDFYEMSNLFIKDYSDIARAGNAMQFHFNFREKIITDADDKDRAIYDAGFLAELSNIESHTNLSDLKGNTVHYIISGRSSEAACDMTEILSQYLVKANRISGRRIEMISEIEPDMYMKNNCLEEIIENNYGGVIVIDLTEKFGFAPTAYQMTCRYLEILVKKYKNNILFVFTYNIENPGFSYYLLPDLSKYIIPVRLKEGSGDRKSAIRYMQKLIGSSDYSMYSKQAGEFMKLFPGEEFTQTDVLTAYEQFAPWCLNKNVLQEYEYDSSDEFMLDRDRAAESPKEKLDEMIGLESVKEQIKTILAADIVEKERKKRKGSSYKPGTMHMIFSGNPGSAKTSVARLFAGIAKEEGVLKSAAFVERGGMDLDGFLCINKIREAFTAAKGGVLFIDEAYSMESKTAVTVLIQELENHRDEVIVIFAGYNEKMKKFIEINEGLKSRIPYWIDFPDYNADELTDILKVMVNERGFSVEEDALKEAHYIFEKACNVDNFGNGRYVRNLIDHALQKQSVRLLEKNKSAEKILGNELFAIIKEDICMPEEISKKEKPGGTAKQEFQEMIGLSNTKSIIEKALASFKLRKICMDRGIVKDKVSLHMVFTGNPGTAKTTVARLFTEILRDEKVLSTGSFVEAGRADLVGKVVGSTAMLVKKKFTEAQGGVLFIDEAYSLCDSYENGYGDEAINTIVQEMENHRDNVIVIFAGYPDKMKQFLDRNPGLLSRIAFQVEFEDYTTDELCAISERMLERKHMKITDQAREKLRSIFEKARGKEDFGNGRFVRKTIEEAEMNLAERLLKQGEAGITEEMLTVIEEADIPCDDPKQKQDVRRMGFCV